MRRRKITGRIPSLQEYMNDVIYHPYFEDFRVTVKEDERIIIEGPGWTVILDHSKGDFSFTGSCIKYYDIEVIRDIWLSYGDIYSIFNYNKAKGLIEKEFVLSKKKEEKLTPLEYQRKYRETHKDVIKERKKEYYQKNKERLMEYQREYMRRKRESDKVVT